MKKIILLVAGFWFLVSGCLGQEIEWQNTIGGSAYDQLYSIQQTSDGGYILGGTSNSPVSGDKTEDTIGYTDYWIVKADSSGNILWQNTIGGNRIDNLYSIQQTDDGGFILGGSSGSNISGDKTENNWDTTLTSFDYWIVKTDASGNILWQKTIGGTSGDQFNYIQQTVDGGYILGGNSGSNISGDKTENSIGFVDYWIVKTDSIGNIQWQNTIGGIGNDGFASLQQTSDGGYILGGYSNSPISGDKTESCKGNYDYWIVKIDVSGNIQWQNTIGGNDWDELHHIQQTTDGGYIFGGYSNSNISGDKTENSIGGSVDYWLVKVDSAGNIQWQNTIGGTDYESLNSLRQTTDGGYILGGESRSNISVDKMENSYGYDDYWIVKTDSAGNIQWQKTIGGYERDYLYSIEQTLDGNFILGGSSESKLSGQKSEDNMGPSTTFDCWVVKITNKYNSITGKLFIDSNSNNIQDSGELAVSNKQITEINTGRFNFSNQNGDYLVTVLDSGNFTVSSNAIINYYNAIPTTHAVYFSGIHQIDSLNDFAFQPTGVFNDLCITITPMGNFRPNQDASYMINYENIGTTTLNVTVIFLPDSDVTFVSSNPTATSVTTDSVIWNVGILAPFQTGSILITVHVNIVPSGTLINSSVRIEPVAGDANTSCNYGAWEVYTTGSFDPNAILVDRDTVLTTELSSPSYLNYIIYFQNTGNDTAFNARVLNNIPQTLDVNSFEFVSSSHPANINYSAASRLLTFTFDNIFLPDSNINELASHGFVRYRIKPNATLVAGDSIKNTAFIYFDFNQPVQTDTAVTEIVLPNGEEEFEVQSSKLKVYPNPVRDELIVNSYSLTGKNAEIKIYDLYGREVFQLETRNQEPATKINVSGFSQGVYFIQVHSGEKTLRTKFVKQYNF